MIILTIISYDQRLHQCLHFLRCSVVFVFLFFFPFFFVQFQVQKNSLCLYAPLYDDQNNESKCHPRTSTAANQH